MRRKFASARAARSFATRSLFTSTIVLAMSGHAVAEDRYWDRSANTNIWATAGNWGDAFGVTDPTAAPGANDLAIFNRNGLTTAQTIDLNANASALGLNFVTSGTVLLQGNGGNRTLTLGTSGITKTGTGAVTIGSAATNGAGLGITLATDQTWTNDDASELIVHNAITGAFNLNYASNSGTGVFRVAGFTEAGTTDLTSTYSGITTLKAGSTVIAQGNAAFGANTAGTVIESGATLNLGGTLAVNTLNLGTEAFTVSGTGVNGTGAIINTGTAGQQNAIQGAVTLAGDTTFGGNQRWDIRNGTLNGENNTLTKIGTNGVYLSGTARLGTNLKQLIIQEGEFVFESGAVATTANVTNGVSVTPTTTGTTSFRNWTNWVDHTANFTFDSSFGGSVARLRVESGNTTHSGTISVAGSDTRFDVAAGYLLNIPSVLSGNGTLRKEDTGTLLLNNAGNTFNGEFYLNNGILGGTGALAATTTYTAQGSTLSPGLPGTAGTFSFANALVSTGTNTAVFNVGSASDLINVGTLSQDGTTNVTIATGPGYAPGTYTLIDYNTLDGFNGFSGFTLANNHIDASLTNTGSAINLTVHSANVPTWSGFSNGIWQTGSLTNPILPNFAFAPAPGGQVEFVANDSVLFDDSATGTTNILTSGTVAPAATRFNNHTKTYSINGAISGSGSILKEGTGTAILLSTPTTLGGLDVNAGTLQLGDDTFSAGYAVGNIDIAAGATLAIAGGNGSTNPQIGTNGYTTLTGAGTLLLNATSQDVYHNRTIDRASVNLVSDLTGFTGNIVINDGNRLYANSINALGNASSVSIQNGGTLFLNAADLNYAGAITASGTGWAETTGALGAIRIQNGTLSGPITLTGDTRISAYSGSGTISGQISGQGVNVEYGLRQIANNGSGTLAISNPNNPYTGNTSLLRITINAATLANAGSTSSLGTGSTLTMESGSLVVTSPTAMTTNRTLILNQLGQGGGALGVADPAGTLTFTGAVINGNANFPISSLDFRQAVNPGTGGTVILDTTSPIRVSGSTVHRTNLTIAGSTQFLVDYPTTGTAAAPTGIGGFNIGNNQNANDTGAVTLTLKDNAVVTAYGDMNIGNANSGAVQLTTVNHTSGTLNALRGGLTNHDDNRALRIGHWPNNDSTYNLSGGNLNAPNGFVSVGWDGNGTFNQSGGTANLAGLRFGNSATSSGTANLIGGTLNIGTLGMLRDGGTATLNLNGGTYRATANHAISSNIYINVEAGGATIDTNGFNVLSASALLAGTTPGGTITKTGAGTFTIPAGDNTMQGTLAINGGSFGGAGTLTNATVNVNSGGTLAGTLAVTSTSGVNIAANGTLSPGNNGGADDGLLSLSTASFSPGSHIVLSGIGDSVQISGAVSGATTIAIVPIGQLGSGPIPLLTYGSGSLDVTPVFPHLTGASITNNGLGTLQLNYTTQETLTWSGSGGAVWDTTTPSTWNASVTGPANFLQGDIVRFTDASAAGNITVQATGVTPASVTFDHSSTAYTLTGGAIGGGGSLTKGGSATTILANDNTYTGSTYIDAGTLQIGNGGSTGSLGLGNTSIAAGATLAFNRTGTSVVSGSLDGGGTLRSTGPGTTLLMGSSSFTGGTVISKGTMVGVQASSFGTGTITLNDASTGTANTALFFNALGNDTAITITNNIVVAKEGTGTVMIGSNERSLRAQGTLINGTVTLGRDTTFVGEYDRTTFGGVISGTADTVTIARSPDLDSGLIGRVTWEATNTFTAATPGKVPTIRILEGAALQLGVGSGAVNQIPDTATVQVDAGGIFQLGRTSDSETIGNLTGSGTVRSVLNAALAITFGTADNTVFDGVINGGNQLSFIKQGTGTATWAGNLDNPTGNIIVSAGTMVFAKASSPTVHAIGGNSQIAAGATLKLAGTYVDNRPEDDGRNGATTAPTNFPANYVDQIYNNVDLTINGTFDMNGRSEVINTLIGGTTGKVTNSVANTESILYIGRNNGGNTFSGILEDGAGKLSLVKTGSGTQTLAGNNTFSGSVEIYGGGAITVTHANALGSTAGTTTIRGSRDGQYGTVNITLGASTPAAPNTVAEPFILISQTESDQRTQIVNTTESSRLTGNVEVHGDGISQFVANQAAGDQFQINSNITGTATGQLGFRGNGEIQLNGVINAPNVQLWKTEGSTFIMNSSGNNYGETYFVHGTVRTDVPNALDPTALLRVGQGGNGNTIDLNGNSQTVAGIRINPGVNDAQSRVITSNSGPATLTIDTPTAEGGDHAFGSATTGVITGQLSITKAGPGAQVLGGFNTYSGITQVTGGELYVNGTHTGGGDDLAFTLGSGASFVLSSTTTLSLDLWSNLHYASQLDGADQTQSDVLAVTAGTIQLAGTLNVANPAKISSWTVGDVFDLFDWFTKPTGTFGTVNLPTLGSGLTWDLTNLYAAEADEPALAGTIKVVAGGSATPIETWRLTHFASTANSDNGADNADPDQDGVHNVVEYALGSGPNNRLQRGTPTFSSSSGSGVISFNRNLAATDVTYVVQASTNLTSWTDLATRTAGSTSWTSISGVAVTDPGTGAVSVADNTPVAGQQKRFMRVVITNPLP